MPIAVQETKAKLPIQLLARQFLETVILRYCTHVEINYNLRTESEVIFGLFFSFPFLYEAFLIL
jgi:hypothetical protein